MSETEEERGHLVDFLWDDFVSVKDGVRGIAGTAKDSLTGRIVPIFVLESALDELNRQDQMQ